MTHGIARGSEIHVTPSTFGSPETPIIHPSIANASVAHSLMVLSRVYNYNHWIYNSARPFIRGKVLEVGAGVGNITQFLLNHPQVTCLEPCKPYASFLRERFADHHNVSVRESLIEELPQDDLPAGSFDSILCANVLEHIKSDQAALNAMAAMTVPGGRVVVVVPAIPWIHGRLDVVMGHHRRYNRRGLTLIFLRSGLRVIHARYFNFIGLFGWWVKGKLLHHERIPERQTRLFDSFVPWLSALERLVPPPIGQSVVVVGQKAGMTQLLRSIHEI